MSSKKPKVLVLSERCPDPTKSAAERRLAGLIDILADISDVCLATQYPELKGSEPKWYRETSARIAEWEGRWLQSILAEQQWDVCILEYWFFAEPIIQMIRARCPGCAIIVDSVDVHFKRELDGVAFGQPKSEALAKKARELDVYKKSDGVIIVSEEDAEVLRGEGVQAHLSFIPIVVTIDPVARHPKPASLLFVGTFYHQPNTDGLGWFLDEIWPALKQDKPDIILNVVGPHAPEELRQKMAAGGVNYHGYVENLDPILSETTVSIAPLRFGAGMKGKVCEALMQGLPLVTTPTGAEGLSLVNGEHAYICRSAEEFVDNLLTLLNNPTAAAEMARKGQMHAEGICSPTAIRKNLGPTIQEWIALNKPTPGSQVRWLAAKLGYRLGRQVRSLGWRVRQLKTSRSS